MERNAVRIALRQRNRPPLSAQMLTNEMSDELRDKQVSISVIALEHGTDATVTIPLVALTTLMAKIMAEDERRSSALIMPDHGFKTLGDLN